MADNYSVFNPTVDLNPYTNEIAEIQRRQRMAQLLQQQGMEPIESQMVSGRVIRTSPWQVLAKALQTGLGAYQSRQADKAAADLREQMAYDQRQKEADVTSAGQAMMGRLTGERPAKPTPAPGATNFDELGYEEAAPTGPRPIQIGANATFAPRSIEEAGKRTIESNQLGEITPTAKYQYDPNAALQMAMTPTGMDAMKANPLLASLMAQMLKNKFEPKSVEKSIDLGNKTRLFYNDGTTEDVVKGAAPMTPYEQGHLNVMEKQAANQAQDLALRRAAAANKPTDEALSSEALNLAVADVAAHPENMKLYASFGASGQAKRTQINNGIASMLKDSGMSNNDLLQLRVSAKANAASAQALTKQANAVQAFEGLAKANGQRVLDLINRLDTTGVPLTEGLLRSVSNKFGSADAAELQSVLTTFQTEVSRILSNPNMTGVVSDSARKEIQEMAPGSMSAAQAKRVINRLFTEMDLRKQYTEEALSGALGRTVVPSGQNAPATSGNQQKPDPLGLR